MRRRLATAGFPQAAVAQTHAADIEVESRVSFRRREDTDLQDWYDRPVVDETPNLYQLRPDVHVDTLVLSGALALDLLILNCAQTVGHRLDQIAASHVTRIPTMKVVTNAINDSTKDGIDEMRRINRKRPYWKGLYAAFRRDVKSGLHIYMQFRRRATAQQPFPVNESEWSNSGLLQPAELLALRNTRLLFLLPSASLGGGTKVVLTEARYLRSMGIEVWIANTQVNRPGFDALLQPDDPPTIYVPEFRNIVAVASEFDVVIATAWWTTEALRLLTTLKHAPTLAYYVQDFEPLFYTNDSEEHRRARASYHVPHCIRFTKTAWTQQEAFREEGASCAVIGPSYDPAEFNSNDRMLRGPTIRICAMVRPETPRRAPELTMRVLKTLKQRHGERLHISVFGCTSEALKASAFDVQFEFEHLGTLVGSEVAQLLRRNDIFLDLSTFQAMGLTAMEAMACGVAVIGPQRGGLSEIIEDGVSGLLVDTLDERACVAAASALVADPLLIDKLATAGRSSVIQHTPQKAAARLARLLLLDKNVTAPVGHQR